MSNQLNSIGTICVSGLGCGGIGVAGYQKQRVLLRIAILYIGKVAPIKNTYSLELADQGEMQPSLSVIQSTNC